MLLIYYPTLGLYGMVNMSSAVAVLTTQYMLQIDRSIMIIKGCIDIAQTWAML